MPEWVVRFAKPVGYQLDHLIARRRVDVLIVNAPTAAAAQIHAIRVTVGETEILSCLSPEEDAAGLEAARAAEPPIPPPPAEDGSFFVTDPEVLRGSP